MKRKRKGLRFLDNKEKVDICGYQDPAHSKWVCVMGPHSGRAHYFRKRS